MQQNKSLFMVAILNFLSVWKNIKL